MAHPGFEIDAIRLESRLSTIETKLSDGSVRDRIASLEKDAKDVASSLTRMETSLRYSPNEKEIGDLLQRLARLETRVAHLPSKGFIVTVVTTIGALVTVAMSFGRLRSVLGLP